MEIFIHRHIYGKFLAFHFFEEVVIMVPWFFKTKIICLSLFLNLGVVAMAFGAPKVSRILLDNEVATIYETEEIPRYVYHWTFPRFLQRIADKSPDAQSWPDFTEIKNSIFARVFMRKFIKLGPASEFSQSVPETEGDTGESYKGQQSTGPDSGLRFAFLVPDV
jgi:hypothetical protein